MHRHLPPAILIALSMIGGLAGWFSPSEASSRLAVGLFFGSLFGYFLGTVSWIFLLADQTPPSSVGRHRVAILLLGAPSGLFAIIGVSAIAYQGDVSWMLLPYAIAPALIVWPFAWVALRKLRRKRQET